MRFESVKAYAFGPFRNETLALTPGMNVVYGSNEAGKSSWHAALYAGLCGMRRARGRRSTEDANFAERHRPWSKDTSWDVGVVIALCDGRRVELRRDLAGGVDSSAHDVDLGRRDYSNEIMNDGAPDGARWVGLDRSSFVLTACIRQADILGLLASPSALQDELQRAAATTGREGTAAEAIARLRNFRAESVGSRRAPTKPLRVSEQRVRCAERLREEAREAHKDYLNHWMTVDKLHRQACELERRLDVARASQAAAAFSEAAERLKRARYLHARLPTGEPSRPSQNANIVRQVATALTTWAQRPDVRAPEGETIRALQDQLIEIDLHLAVRAERAAKELEKQLARARALNTAFPHGRPRRSSEYGQLEQDVASALIAWESRPDVQVPTGPTMEQLEQDLAGVESQLGEAGASGTHQERDVSGGLFVKLLHVIRRFVAALLRLFGGGPREVSTQPAMRQVLEERRELIGQRIAARKQAEQQWKEAALRVREAADGLQAAAAAAGCTPSSHADVVTSLREWQERRTERLTEIDNQMNDWAELQQILGERTINDLEQEVATAREEAASAAARTDADSLTAALSEPDPATSTEAASEHLRLSLLHQIDERHRQERVYTEAMANCKAAEEAVAEAARLVGIEEEEPEAQSDSLRSWQDNRDAELKKADREIEEWSELQRILGHDSLDELACQVDRLQTEARHLSEELLVKNMADLAAPPTDVEFRESEREARKARTAFDRAESRLQALGRNSVDVAAAEEELIAAKREHHRVLSLDRTLDLTISFLKHAEENVHRTIAPVLAATVRKWLPKVTDGRYKDCRIAPEKLAVEVATANNHWQQAELLSHGTAEQVYLLLRLALVQHLTSESCPLILDDAVAAADSTRKRSLLETLLAISESTQVVLFTHENDVCAWARERLVSEPHKLTRLESPDSLTG